uniref:Uncharacterized protein n=1 Tax=Panagrolaimus superbus TaxID=310955 RepID=A0A914Y9G1_9BILA
MTDDDPKNIAKLSNVKKRFDYGGKFEASLSRHILESEPMRRIGTQKLEKVFSGKVDDRVQQDFSICRTLCFDEAKLKWINPQWFVPKLSSLTIQNDNVFNIPNSWKDLTDNIKLAENLKELQLINCMISKIPKELFLNLSKTLQTLTLIKNNLTEIPIQIEALENLMHLDVSNNPELTSENIAWEKLSIKLRTLKLNDTGVTWLPESLGRFKDLHILEVVTPDLQAINFELLLPRLKQLYIKNNDYKKVTKMALSPRRLKLINANVEDFDDAYIPKIVQFLDLSFNTFNNLNFPDRLTSLQELRLTNCSLKAISLSSFPEFTTVLDLSHNELESVGDLNACPRLKEVYLNNNHLTETVHGFNYNRLHVLDLSYNQISKLNPNFKFIVRNSEWLELNLGYNHFHAENGNLDERLWKYLPKTKRLNLSGNRLFEVSCEIAENELPIDNVSIYKPLPSLQPGKWCAKIRTRLCEECKDVLIASTDKSYDEFLIAESLKKKQSENCTVPDTVVHNYEMEMNEENNIVQPTEDVMPTNDEEQALIASNTDGPPQNIWPMATNNHFYTEPQSSNYYHHADATTSYQMPTNYYSEPNEEYFNGGYTNVPNVINEDWPMMEVSDDYFTQNDSLNNNQYFNNSRNIFSNQPEPSQFGLQPFTIQNEGLQSFESNVNQQQFSSSMAQQQEYYPNCIQNDQQFAYPIPGSSHYQFPPYPSDAHLHTEQIVAQQNQYYNSYTSTMSSETWNDNAFPPNEYQNQFQHPNMTYQNHSTNYLEHNLSFSETYTPNHAPDQVPMDMVPVIDDNHQSILPPIESLHNNNN